MNIGNAARASGLSAKMIRYYEATGLVPKPTRRESNYRDYDESDVNRLVFVRRARELGFDMELVRKLLSLWSDQRRPKAEVRAIAAMQVARLQTQATHLEEMITTLRRLIATCKRQTRPDCPIMIELSSKAQTGRKSRKRRHASRFTRA
jgi:Cu(I)-responsive transcriptional regulator